MAATMSSMQILTYEYRNADLASRGYTKNQLNLHLLALQHLRKTYWAAEVQCTLFKTCMAVVERDVGLPEDPLASRVESRLGDMGPPRQVSGRSEPSDSDRPDFESLPSMDLSISDYLEVFKPFMGMPSYSDDLG